MIVAIPGVVSDEDETTTARLLGCAGGPLGLMGVTTGLYWLPQPATRAAAANAAPAFTKRARVWLKFIEKSLIQFFPAYRLIVNQEAGAGVSAHAPCVAGRYDEACRK
jgi:hypothetical protein